MSNTDHPLTVPDASKVGITHDNMVKAIMIAEHLAFQMVFDFADFDEIAAELRDILARVRDMYPRDTSQDAADRYADQAHDDARDWRLLGVM